MSDDRLDKILILLGQVDGKVTELAKAFDGHQDDDTIRFGKMEIDLQRINKTLNYGTGFVSAAGAIIGSIATLWFKGH